MRRALCTCLALVTLACSDGADPSEPQQRSRSGPGVTETEIRLGVLSDESGPRSNIGLPRVQAARLFFQALNDDGGVNGRRVRLVTADHHFDRELAGQQYAEMRDSVLMFEQVYPLVFFNERLRDERIPASTVARYSSLADEPSVIMTGTPYRIEMSNAVDWLAGTLPDPASAKVAAVTQGDDYGADGLAGIEAAVANHGLDLVTKLTYQPADEDFSAQVRALEESGADHVFLTTSAPAAAKIVEGCAQIGYRPGFIGSYFSFDRKILVDNPTLAALYAKGWKTSGPFARWGEDVPGMKRLLDAVTRYAPDQQPDPFFLHGWIQAALVAEILERADETGDLTRAGLVAAVDGMSDVDMGGLSARLSFGPDAAQGPPSRQTRMFETVVGDPAYPDMLKPITDFYTGTTASVR